MLTARGREAAKACAEARKTLDAEVVAAIGQEGFATHARRTSRPSSDWKEAYEQHH